MELENTLFSEFEKSNANQWEAQIIKDLKLENLDTLIWRHPNGFDIKPFYTKDDLVNNPRQVFKTSNDWEIRQQIVLVNEKEANAEALNSLMNGASGLEFILAEQSTDIELLLQDIMPAYAGVHFSLAALDLNILKCIELWFKKSKVDCKQIVSSVFVKCEPLTFVETWKESGKKVQHIFEDFPCLRTIGISTENLPHKLNDVEQLALLFAQCIEILDNENALNIKDALGKVHFRVSVGSEYFLQIAKIRALKLMWQQLTTAYGINETIKPYVLAYGSTTNKSKEDLYTNLLRNTTEGMSAALAGADSVILPLYDNTENAQKQKPFAMRMSRNIQLILKHEAFLDRVQDPAAGSYYIETLSAKISTAAMALVKKIETEGGFSKSTTVLDILARK